MLLIFGILMKCITFRGFPKKSKQIAKLISRKTEAVALGDSLFRRILIRFRTSSADRGLWSLALCEKEADYCKWLGYLNIMKVPPKENQLSALELTDHLMEVFKCPKINLVIERICREERNSWLKWAMDSSFPVKNMYFRCAHEKDEELFFEIFDKPVDCLELFCDFNREERWKRPENKRIIQANRFILNLQQPLCFDMVYYVDALAIDIDEIASKNFEMPAHGEAFNQELNSFVKSWQSRLTNYRMKSACFRLIEPIKFEKVLHGIKFHQRDPRTVKRAVKLHNKTCWIVGGIDIKRVDGTIATILWENYKIDDESSEIPVNLIEQFEKVSKIGEEEASNNLFNDLNTIKSNNFSIYVW